MPILNGVVGVNQLVTINGQFILAENSSRNNMMEVQPVYFMQGTVMNRVMSIGGISETITIAAPILVGGGSYIDGRKLLTSQIANSLNPSTAVLPLLQKASIDIATQKATVNITLLSDGNPSTEVFTVSALTASSLTDGTHNDVLNPLTSMPTRVAEFYDFRVALAGFQYLVESGHIEVDIEIQKKYFIAGNDGTNTTTPVPSPNPNNFGTQFPWLATTGITISGSGKAVVQLLDKNNDGVYTYSTDPTTNETLNVILGSTQSELTLQSPGQTITSDEPFSIQVYWNPTGGDNAGTWVDLFSVVGTGVDLFDLSKSLIKNYRFTVTPQLMTADFDFQCYVATPNL